MILVVDVGNTNIVLGIYEGKQLRHDWRISTNRSATADEYGIILYNLFQHAGISLQQIEGVIISSVVPPLMFVLEQLCLKYVKKTPLIVGPGIKTGLNIRYENPREVGADRIVNAVAAIELYGAPCIVVDFGTATTFDYIDEQGQYVGGAVAPGIGISTEALYQRAAKLPHRACQAEKCGRPQYNRLHAGWDHLWLCRAGGRHCRPDPAGVQRGTERNCNRGIGGADLRRITDDPDGEPAPYPAGTADHLRTQP